MTEILTGQAAVEAASESEFEGMSSPRNYRISEALQDKAATYLDDAFRGKRGAALRLEEAFSTSDFTLAAFATIDQRMLQQYDAMPSTWRQYTDTTTVNDFRPKVLRNKWRNTIGFEKVPELTEYPAEDSRGASSYSIAVAKWGRRFSLSWEAWINNEAINELEDLPGVLARQADETESINAVLNLLLAPATGATFSTDVNTAFFKSANGNAPAALPLTLPNVDIVLSAMAAKKSAVSGRQIASPPLTLVVPRALERTAQRILDVKTIRRTSGADEYEYDNFVNFDYVVEPMLDYYNTHAAAATTWFILPKPGGPQPAVWAAFLRGYETPDLRVKASGGSRVGGGEVAPLEGSFERDDIQYRGRHIVGNQQGDPTFTYVSRGA